MPYRILLPSTEQLTDDAVERALAELHVERVNASPPAWRVCERTDLPNGNSVRALAVELLPCIDVKREEYDAYFFTPHGVQDWLVVRIARGGVNRRSRIQARQVALGLAQSLDLPAIETRNGVYCRTPEAFAAWCARRPHKQTVVFARPEHCTTLPPRSPGVLRA